VFARRPEALLLAQFWAEDGSEFYQSALDSRPLAALLQPYAGYLHVFPRLVAWASTLFAAECAPVIFNVVAIFVAGACVWLFALPLARPVIAGDGLRLALCLLFILGNPAVETYGTLTNVHWWLCLGTLVLVSAPLEGRWLVPLACLVVGLSALSSPLPVLLAPLVVLTIVVGGRRYRAAGITLLICAALQVLARLFLSGEEPKLPGQQNVGSVIMYTLDACQSTLLQVIPGYELATRLHEWHRQAGWLLAGGFFIGLVVRALRPWCRHQGVLVAGAVYVLAVMSLVAVLTRFHTWPSEYLLQSPIPLGGRYVFVPYAACIFLLGLAVQRSLGAPLLRIRALALTLLLAAFVLSVTGRPPMIALDNLEWPRRVREARHRGGKSTIPINPQGWTVELRIATD
jgi:hypothetical protein